MSEQPPERPERPDEGHPIAAGLIALVSVGVVVGLILGLIVFAGSKIVGLGGGDDASDTSGGYTLVVPRPQKTTGSSGPEITLAPDETASSSTTGKARPHKTKSTKPELEITLAASTTAAGPMEPFNLTGVYPGGEGAILQVQRFQDGRWAAFNATGSVSGEQFQIPVQTSQPGVNRFRVVDTDTGLESSEARVTIG